VPDNTDMEAELALEGHDAGDMQYVANQEDAIPMALAQNVNETIVVSDNEDESELAADSPTVPPPVVSDIADLDVSQLTANSEVLQALVVSYDFDDSVLVTPNVHDEPDLNSNVEEPVEKTTALAPKTLRPETIKWEKLREDVTIPMNFDLHFAHTRSPEAAVVLETANDQIADLDLSDLHQAEAGPSQERNTVASERTASTCNSTVDLNDFIDFAALAEPTVRIDASAAAEAIDVSESARQYRMSGATPAYVPMCHRIY
jgi:hypothetical protein